jgi:hypothetical protein
VVTIARVVTLEARAEQAESTVEGEIEELVARLQSGFEFLENARSSGKVVTRWDDEWIRLLRRYEALMDQLAA